MSAPMLISPVMADARCVSVSRFGFDIPATGSEHISQTERR